MSDQSEYASSLSSPLVDNENAKSVSTDTEYKQEISTYPSESQPSRPTISDEQNRRDPERGHSTSHRDHQDHDPQAEGELVNLPGTGNSSYDTSGSSRTTGQDSVVSDSGYLKEEEEDEDENSADDHEVLEEDEFSDSSSPREMLPTLTPTARPGPFSYGPGQALSGYYYSPNPNVYHQSDWSTYVPVPQHLGTASNHYATVHGHPSFDPRHRASDEPYNLHPGMAPPAHPNTQPPPPLQSSYAVPHIESFRQAFPGSYYPAGYHISRTPLPRFQEPIPEPHHYSTGPSPRGYAQYPHTSHPRQAGPSRSQWSSQYVSSLGHPGPMSVADHSLLPRNRISASSLLNTDRPLGTEAHDNSQHGLAPSMPMWRSEEPPSASPPAAVPRGPPLPHLVRTTALSQMATSWGNARTQYEQLPDDYSTQTQAQLIIEGSLNAITLDWTRQERKAHRRLVQFQRRQSGTELMVSFRTIDPEAYNSSNAVVSCIWWEERQKYFVTSVDCILLLELIIDQKFTVEEKNRIRRNLEGCKPQTVSKSREDSKDFFRLIMQFDSPKPRNIEKDVKVFEWSMLGDALKRIVGKYSASWTPA